MPLASIDNRALIDVTGPDGAHLLQTLITTDIEDIGDGETWPGALLTPQGKILFEFLIGRRGDGFVLETAEADADPLIKRLTLYRLRAKVDFKRLESKTVAVAWDDAVIAGESYRDMRFAKAGLTLHRLYGTVAPADDGAYPALRLANGISGAGEDDGLKDYFPHDLLMDRNGGLDFRKGCYIGQEVVSRMQHRSTARRRLVRVTSPSPLPESGNAISVGDRSIGELVTSAGNDGLAVVRIDKAGAAMVDEVPITCGGIAVTLALPAWSGLEFPREADEAQP